MGITRRPFGITESGIPVELFTLENGGGMKASITNYGGTIVSISVPDRNGIFEDVCLGFDSLDGYLGIHPYFGGIIGRYANRISNARFSLGGTDYNLSRNDGHNQLHGGSSGFDRKTWSAVIEGASGDQALSLRYVSPDGEEGYPGALATKVAYSLDADGGLRIEYTATCDRDTVINLTNHAYFNLAGQNGSDILDHELLLRADFFTPVSESMIPTGKIEPVVDTPMDFRQPVSMGLRIREAYPQLRFGPGGYDHNWVLDRSGQGLELAARVRHPDSGRVLEVWTTEPAIQFYSGNYLDAALRGKSGIAYGKHSGFCLETQHYPDSPNQPAFPSTVLKAGEVFRSTTVYRFRVD